MIFLSLKLLNPLTGMNKLITILILSSVGFQASGQKGIKLEIQDEAELFYSGEQLNYLVELGGSGSVLQLEIVDAQGTTVAKELIEVQGQINGSIVIPKNSPSGTYVFSVVSLDTKIAPGKELFSVLNPGTFESNQVGQCCDSIEFDGSSHVINRNPLAITGKVLQGGKAQSNIVVLLQVRGEDASFDYTITDSDGDFEFDSRIVGQNEILITTPDDQNMTIDIAKNIYSTRSAKDLHPYPLSIEMMSQQNVESAILRSQFGERTQTEIKKVQPLVFDRTLVIKDYVQMNSTLEAIREIVPFTKIKYSKKDTSVYLLNLTDNMFHKSEPLVLVDGFVEPDFRKVIDLSLDKIVTIRAWYSGPSKFIELGRFARFGVISLETNDNMVPSGGVHSVAQGLAKTSKVLRNDFVKEKVSVQNFSVASGYGVGNLEFTLVGEARGHAIANGDLLFLPASGERFQVVMAQVVVAQKSELTRVILKCTEQQYQYLSELEDINIVFEILKQQN